MRSVRQVIIARAKELGLGPAGVCRLVEGKVHRQTIYNMFNGREVQTDTLNHLLPVLGLKIVAAPDSIRDSKPARRAGRKRKQS